MASTREHKSDRERKRAPPLKISSKDIEQSISERAGSLSKGVAIIIGGGEDKKKDKTILKEFVKRLKGGKIVIVPTASEIPNEVAADYVEIFKSLGATKVAVLEVLKREEAFDKKKLEVFKGARGVFMTGGDQLKITSELGGTPVMELLLKLLKGGGIIAGTSAGASVMSETMLVSGRSQESHKINGSLQIGNGLGLIKDVIIDQHFAQRGRIGRLLGAIAQNPGLIGMGIDEDTAVIYENHKFNVIGSGAVYIVDGKFMKYTNIADHDTEKIMCAFNVVMHVLCEGNGYDLICHEPIKCVDSHNP